MAVTGDHDGGSLAGNESSSAWSTSCSASATVGGLGCGFGGDWSLGDRGFTGLRAMMYLQASCERGPPLRCDAMPQCAQLRRRRDCWQARAKNAVTQSNAHASGSLMAQDPTSERFVYHSVIAATAQQEPQCTAKGKQEATEKFGDNFLDIGFWDNHNPPKVANRAHSVPPRLVRHAAGTRPAVVVVGRDSFAVHGFSPPTGFSSYPSTAPGSSGSA